VNVLIVYDSAYGNTEKIAQSIGSAIGSQHQVNVLRVKDVTAVQLAGLSLLIAGSPTQRFRPTQALSDFLNGLSEGSLRGVRVAAFDTRLTVEEIKKTPVLAFFVKLAGNAYAAKPIADALKKKGSELILAPEGFYVKGMEGPLLDGEVERAAAWAGQIVALVK
jgi:flavodoxin